MVALARITDDPRTAKQALLIARNAATHLIGLCDPAGSPLAFVPPTYDDQHPVAKKSSWWKQRAEGRVMLTESFFAADAWLDLYDVTGAAEYLEAVKRMVTTYAKCQIDRKSVV